MKMDSRPAVLSPRTIPSPSPAPWWKSETFLLAVILFAGTVTLYLPALSASFVNYDDPAYVTRNVRVLSGLSWSNVKWAITAGVEANWHPLSWISHMADVQMFGLNPWGHHLVSVMLHAANVLLLFFVLRGATGCVRRSAVAAALFAVHPLNVECVAWVAERKSLLSMLFLLLTLVAYRWYVSKRSLQRYAAVFCLFALALAAKPMVVTLPLLLLLWDYWPLRRLDSRANPPGDRAKSLTLVAEKIPLLVLSAASSLITLWVQRHGGALGSTTSLPLKLRIENAIWSYVAYLAKGIWPSGLAVFYPHPEGSLAFWRVLAAGLILIAISWLAWRARERHRYLIVGWLWYLIAMIPMIGIVQVGRQAMADRYAYLPLIGLFIIAVWGCAELFGLIGPSNAAQRAIVAAVLLGYASVAFLQINYWRNSYTLFSHALQVTSRNGIAEDNLGTALMEMGRPDLAQPHFEAAVQFVPQLSTAHYNLGVLLQEQNRPDAATQEYKLALQYTSDATEVVQAQSNLGFLSLASNDPKTAIEHFNAALQIDPGKQNSLVARGMAEFQVRNLDAAVKDLSRAAQVAPSAQANFWLGRALEDKGEAQAAARAYEAALQIAPGMTDAQQRLDALRSGQPKQ
jgi:protein O-mannosyl-transferase